MKLISYSSGYEICGVADYNRHLMPELASHFQCDTVNYPVERAARDNLRGLFALRKKFVGLAKRSADYDVALVHWVTRFWNGGRPVETMFPAFLNQIDRPVVLVLHEWPTIPKVHSYKGSTLSRLAKRTLTTAWVRYDVKERDYAQWLEREMFARMSRIIVHTSELRDRLLAQGVRPEVISVQRFPLHHLPRPTWTPAEVNDRFGLRGRKALLLLGFPVERKGYDLAVRALAQLPAEVVLLLVCPMRNDAEREQVGSLQALATAEGVGGRLLVTGYLDDAQLASVFGVATLALSPFRAVTGSSSVAHFLAGGLAVIASDLPPLRAIAEQGAGIALFPPGDVDALARTIATLLSDPQALQALREKTRGYAEQTSFETLARAISELAAAAIRTR